MDVVALHDSLTIDASLIPNIRVAGAKSSPPQRAALNSGLSRTPTQPPAVDPKKISKPVKKAAAKKKSVKKSAKKAVKKGAAKWHRARCASRGMQMASGNDQAEWRARADRCFMYAGLSFGGAILACFLIQDTFLGRIIPELVGLIAYLSGPLPIIPAILVMAGLASIGMSKLVK